MTHAGSIEPIDDLNRQVERFRPQIAAIVRHYIDLAASPASDPDPVHTLLAEAGFRLDDRRNDDQPHWRARLRGHDGARLLFSLETHPEPELGHIAGRPLAATATAIALALLVPHLRDADATVEAVVPLSPQIGWPGLSASTVRDGGDFDAAIQVQVGAASAGIAHASQAGQLLELRFAGTASHAAAAPERGVNALEGAIQTIGLVNALRQHLRSEIRIHGIIGAGGAAVNIVPDRAVLQYWIRTPGPISLERTVARIEECARSAAIAAGATVESERLGSAILNLVPNQALTGIGEPHWSPLGDGATRESIVAPTGFGTLSQEVPALLALFAIPEKSAHTLQLASWIERSEALAAAERAIVALVRTVRDLVARPDVLGAARAEHDRRMARLREFARPTPAAR